MLQWNEAKRCFRVRVALRVGGKPREKSRWVAALAGEGKRETERRAKAIELELTAQLRSERGAPRRGAEPVTFAEFIDDIYYHRCVSVSNRGGKNLESTMRAKRDVLESHLIPFFGDKKLRELRQRDVDEFVRQQEAASFVRTTGTRKYANTTIATHLKLLRHVLSTAVEVGCLGREHLPRVPIGDNVPERRKRFHGRLTSDECYTEDEVRRLLAEAKRVGPRFFALMTLLCRLGPRIGEALALQWEDLDFKRGTIHFRNQIYVGVIRAPKTGAREISLHPTVATALAAAPRTGPFVFASGRDPSKPVSPRTVRDTGKRCAKAAGIHKGFRPHACRHTAASAFLAKGVSPAIVAKWMGHTVKVLMQVYAHLLETESHGLMLSVRFDDGPAEACA